MALLQTGIYFYGHSVCNSSLVQLLLVSDRGDNTLTEDIFIYINPLAMGLSCGEVTKY
jgi:dTDP-glucose pyrophosphorylase